MPFPQQRSEREAVVQTAASLLRDIDRLPLPSLPPLPALPAASSSDRLPRSTPRPVPSSPSAPPSLPPAPTVVETAAASPLAGAPPPALPAPLPAPAPAPAPALSPVAETVVGAPPSAPAAAAREGADAPATLESSRPPGLRASAWGSVGLELRPFVRPAARVALWGGAVARHVRVGLGCEAVAPAGLVGFAQGDQVHRLGVLAGVWGRWSVLELGPVVGVAAHGYRSATTPTTWVEVPAAGASLGVLPIPALRMEVRAMNDLREVQLYVGDDRVELAKPWSVQLGVGWMPLTGAGRKKDR
jgi:hypothetical protein